MNLKSFLKPLFFWKKPKAIVVVSKDPEVFRKVIFQVIGTSWLRGKEVLVFAKDQNFKLAQSDWLVLDFDQEEVRKFKEKTTARVLTFGFREGADFQATDLKENGGLNFKVVWQGKVVPFWLGEGKDQEAVYPALAAAAVGTVFGLNLVEISQKM